MVTLAARLGPLLALAFFRSGAEASLLRVRTAACPPGEILLAWWCGVIQRWEGFMGKIHLCLVTGLVALCAVAVASGAHASSIPISGTFTATGSAGAAPVFTETFDANGSDTPFGSFTGSESATADVTDFPAIALSDGTFQFNFATGFISGTFSGSGSYTDIMISFLITGGLLPGDTGSGTGSGSFDLTTGSITGSYSGTISAPDDALPGLAPLPAITPLPPALPLFATGLGALGLLGWRRKRKAVAFVSA